MGYKIRVNSVHPSFAETAMVEELIASSKNPERTREGLARAAPLGRLGRPEEIAQAILYLASDEAAFTTGAEIIVDGGLTVGQYFPYWSSQLRETRGQPRPNTAIRTGFSGPSFKR